MFLLAGRMRRYFEPKANGELKCTPQALDLYKSEKGRGWTQYDRFEPKVLHHGYLYRIGLIATA